MPGSLASCTCSKVSKFLRTYFALLELYNVVQLILHWVTSQRIVFWKKAAHKGYKTISYVAVFAISGIPPINLVILNNLDVRENYLSTCLGRLDGMIPVSLLPHPSPRKPITLVSYTYEVFQEYKTVCFTDGSKLNGRVGVACVIYEEGVENFTFQHRLRDECLFFKPNYSVINLVVKLIQDSLRQGRSLNFLIYTV
ncbi:transforming growth factor-beta-induced protein ig-h3 [Trichonephila clavipes]|nr:transforming growth factor-beta-induced protein ig-h3 [Trichonephila clavipes]